MKEHIPTKQSLVTPWFDQPGGGVQYKFKDEISGLAKEDKSKNIKPKIKLIGELKNGYLGKIQIR